MQATGGWKLRRTDTLLGCGLSLHAGTWWVLCWVSGELRYELGLMLFEKGNRCGQCWLPFPIFSWENLGSMLWFAREKKHWSCRYVCTVCLLIAFFESYGKSWKHCRNLIYIYIWDELEYKKIKCVEIPLEKKHRSYYLHCPRWEDRVYFELVCTC